MEKTLLLVPMFPLVGALLTYVISGKDERHHRMAGWIATFAAAGSFILTIQLWRALAAVEGSVISAHAWTWFEVLPFKVEFSFLFDRLSAVMTLIITGVGSLIHLYAIGYMDHDPERPRFFAYLNLFLFSMLL
ncbi:MAG: NADH-quinone oxidoreductase subunit L, partial [Bdellovibrionales bacterium]|nr:NADH-quinone oxidoreductase subunit L [Bdellovibrionales bacterium]